MIKKIFIGIVILFLAHLIFIVWSYRTEYTTHYNAKYWKDRYLHSQWIVPNSKQSIGDDGLYAYTGWEYFTGRDPTTVNAEVPPLGKYIIGLSIFIFHNQNIFALLSGIFVLISFYLLNTVFLKSKLYAFIPVFLFSFEPLFTTQLRAPFLDLLYLGFFLLSCYFLLKRRYIVSTILLGAMISTKNSASTFLLITVFSLLYLVITQKRKELKKYMLCLPLSIAIFLLSYTKYFLTGHTIRQFLGVQKWILAFYTNGAKGTFISPWEIVLTGNWPTWWNTVERVSEWHIGWPILLLICVYGMYILIKKRTFQQILFLPLWILIYMLFLSFIPVWPRYMLLLLPIMYTFSLWVFFKSSRIKVK